jgi:hypothetical protein
VTTGRVLNAAEFYGANPRRAESKQWDRGHWYEGPRHAQITWIEATWEVCAIYGRHDEESYEVLGRLPSYELLEALLADGHEHDQSLGWARGRIQCAPTGRQADELVAAYATRLAAEDADQERREIASFEVVDLSDLPSTPEEFAERYPDSDWSAIAELAVAAFESGISPRDLRAVERFAARSELSPHDRSALLSLFVDPIVARPGDDHFTNGRHRVAAMRRASVRRCVVHTHAGYDRDG